jgi:dTDP-glucose 4,6-dehydratase
MNPLADDLDHILRHTAGLWEELRGKRIFITGGTGFFGRWILESFAHANDQLGLGASAVVLTRNPGKFVSKAPTLSKRDDIDLVCGDVRRFDLPEGEFSHIIHGGTTSSSPVEPLEMFDTIVEGTRQVVQFASTHGTRKLLFISSGAVYGRQPPGMTHIPESYSGGPDPLDRGSAYGEGKRAAELLCILGGLRHGFEPKLARCFAFVGPHLPLDAHFAIGNFIRDAICGNPITVNGDGTTVRSYLYAADLAIWLWTVLFAGLANEAYNVGSESALTIGEVAHAVSIVFPSKPLVNFRNKASESSMNSTYVPSTQKAGKHLGLSQVVVFEEAIHRTIAWNSESRMS